MGYSFDGGKASREMSAASWLERRVYSLKGNYEFINIIFFQVEEAFFAEREAADFPDFYTEFTLQLFRNDLLNQLLREAKPEYHTFIIDRSKMPVEFPAVPKSKVQKILEEIERKYAFAA